MDIRYGLPRTSINNSKRHHVLFRAQRPPQEQRRHDDGQAAKQYDPTPRFPYGLTLHRLGVLILILACSPAVDQQAADDQGGERITSSEAWRIRAARPDL